MLHDHSEKPAHQRICRLASCRNPFIVCVDCDPTDRRIYCSDTCRKLAVKESKKRYRSSQKGKLKQSAYSKRHREKQKQKIKSLKSVIAPDEEEDSDSDEENKKKEKKGKKVREPSVFPLRFLRHLLMIMLTVSSFINGYFFMKRLRCRFCHAVVTLVEEETSPSFDDLLLDDTHCPTSG